MSERFVRHAFACGLGVALCTLAGRGRAELGSTRAQLGSEIEVRLLDGYPRSRHAYYGPITFGLELHNHGRERSVQVEIKGSAHAERTLHLPARERVRSFFYAPAGNQWRSRVEVELSDSASGKRVELAVSSRAMNEETIARLYPLQAALNVDKPWELVGALDAHVPDDWRGLAGIRAIVLEHEAALASAPDWPVLVDWVVMGGVLLVATTRETVQNAPPWPQALPFAGAVEETQGGLVQRVGLGALVRVWPEELGQVNASFLERIGVCQSCRWNVIPSEATDGALADYARMRLKNAVKEPGWLLFYLLLLFAAVAGPLGWVACVKRRGQPLLYLAFVLATALVFSGAVLARDLVENGIDPTVRVRSLLLIDQRNTRELGFEEAALYAPMSRGTQLRLHPNAQLLVVTLDATGATALDVSSEEGRQIVRGAVPIRQRQLIGTRFLQPARGRLEVADSDGGIVVENHLGVDLQTLIVWRGQSAYVVSALARGARARATPAVEAEVKSRMPLSIREPIIGAAWPLAQTLIDGDLGADRFIGSFAWTSAGSGLFGERVLASGSDTQVIAGVY